MQKNEAVSLIKNISDNFSSLFPIAIGLLPQESKELHSDGFEIHVFAHVDKTRLLWLKSMLKKRNLHLKKLDEKNLLLIY